MNDNLIDKIIKPNGNSNYAYVVVLFQNDIYASASIVFAESVRKIGCLCDLVIMIDKKISKEIIEIIRKFYNKIFFIELIELGLELDVELESDLKLKKSVQNNILTKINAFRLEEYKKIFLIDIDTILFTSLDSYFISESVPSIGYSDFISNLESNNNLESTNELETKVKNYGFLLIEPSKKLFTKAIKIINKYKSKLNKVKKPFEFVINKLYPNISVLPIKLSSKKFYNVDCIQYQGDKPFLMSGSLEIDVRVKLNHFKIWFSYFITILNKYPELKKIIHLKETIDVSKYFLAPISRFILDITKTTQTKRIDWIKNIYPDIKITKLSNLNYYHLDISKDYSSEFINYSGNISEIKFFLDYLTYITQLDFSNYYKCTCSKEIIEMMIRDKNNICKNVFLNYYIRIFGKSFVILHIDKINQNSNNNNILSELKNNILYENINFIQLDGFTILNLLFNLLQNYTYSQRLQMLKQKYCPNLTYKVNYYIYETIGQIDVFDMIGTNSSVFVLFDKKSKIRFGSIFLNPSTIEIFKKSTKFVNFITIQNNLMILNKKSLINLIYYQTLKKWIYGTYSGSDIGHIIISNIHNIGIPNNKIILIDNITNNITQIKKINNSKIFFVDVIFLKVSQYNNILSDKKKIILSIYNAEYHWELDGIKFLID